MIEHVEGLFQKFHETIPGINSAPYPNPRTLDTFALPCTLSFLMTGDYYSQGGLRFAQCPLRVDVFYLPENQAIYEEARAGVAELHKAVTDVYLGMFDEEDNYMDYGDVSGYRVYVDRKRRIQVSGFRMDLTWFPEVNYFGFSLVVPVTVNWGESL